MPGFKKKLNEDTSTKKDTLSYISGVSQEFSLISRNGSWAWFAIQMGLSFPNFARIQQIQKVTACLILLWNQISTPAKLRISEH